MPDQFSNFFIDHTNGLVGKAPSNFLSQNLIFEKQSMIFFDRVKLNQACSVLGNYHQYPGSFRKVEKYFPEASICGTASRAAAKLFL